MGCTDRAPKTVKLPLFAIVFGVIVGIGMAGACAFCAAKPNIVAAYFRDKYMHAPKWSQSWPFAGFMMKNWYPSYLRVVGVCGFFFALIWLTVVISEISK